jgi:hypothetical protein
MSTSTSTRPLEYKYEYEYQPFEYEYFAQLWTRQGKMNGRHRQAVEVDSLPWVDQAGENDDRHRQARPT